MSIEFSTNISALRRERNISQKDAAHALGISQALLSHYEKGIRECNLDFVKKAAEYYDVTADYLLGISENRHGINELSDFEPIPDDNQMKVKTVLRSILYLAAAAENNEDNLAMFFSDYFALCVKKYLSLISPSGKKTATLCDLSISFLNANPIKSNKSEAAVSPQFLNTLSAHALMLINKDIENALK